MFWKAFLNAAISGALQAGSGSAQNNSDIKTTGAALGVGAVAGILQFLLQHPAVPVSSIPTVNIQHTLPVSISTTS